MPIIANAKKALRQSKARHARNKVVKAHVRAAEKKHAKLAKPDTLTNLFSVVDKAVKKHIIHKNKAARIKARAAKRVVSTPPKTTAKKPKTAVKKTTTN